MRGPRVLVLDTETTGIDAPIGVVEIAWAHLNEDLDIEDEFLSDVNPELPIGCSAAGVTGRRTEDIEDSWPTLAELDWPTEPVILVCHNVAFDKPLVEKYLNIVDELCTYKMSRRLLPDAPEHKLATLSCYCDLPRYLSHRAYGDVRDTWGLLNYLVEGYGGTLEDLIAYSKTPTVFPRMPFGKHKGEMMKDVPKGYLTWLSKQDLDEDMRSTLDHWRYK